MRTLESERPLVAARWHPTKNGSLTPADVSYSSMRRIWWKCQAADDHEWESAPNSMTASDKPSGRGCPFCVGQRVCKSNCISTTHPSLLAEWDTPKNEAIGLTPDTIVAGSSKIAWWRCHIADDHLWRASIVDRAARNRGCPYCHGKKVSKSNCLATTHPHIAALWDGCKNVLSADQITAGSSRKFWWVCPKDHDHVFEATVKNVVNSTASGCPYCCGFMVSASNCLLATHPQTAAEWHPTKNAPSTPCDVTRGDRMVVAWVCRAGHEWSAPIRDRTAKGGSSCPSCTQSSGEAAVANHLIKRGMSFVKEWRRPAINARFDFKITTEDEIVLIEYHGHQHYMPVPFGSLAVVAERFAATIESDRRKVRWCEDNNIKLLIVPYWELKNVGVIIDAFLDRGVLPSATPPASVNNRIERHRRKYL